MNILYKYGIKHCQKNNLRTMQMHGLKGVVLKKWKTL